MALLKLTGQSQIKYKQQKNRLTTQVLKKIDKRVPTEHLFL